MALWGNWESKEHERLRTVAHAIADQLKVKVTLDSSQEGGSCRTDKAEITIGCKDLWLHGADFYIGLLLHEIGHLRYSPKKGSPELDEASKADYLGTICYNATEDVRINELMKNDYAGAAHYQSELYSPTLSSLESNMSRRVVNDLSLQQRLTPWRANEMEPGKRRDEIIKESTPEIEADKRMLFGSLIALAHLKLYGMDSYGLTTSSVELDDVAEEIAPLLRDSRDADSIGAVRLARNIRLLIPDILVPVNPPNQEGSGEGKGGQQGQQEGCDVMETIKEGISAPGTRPGGYGFSKSNKQNGFGTLFIEANERATPYVEKLKRRMIAALRDNQHQRYTSNHRKGLLDKKNLIRTARDNYRVYRKRNEIKGKEYVVSLILDCSGSMFHSTKERIERAMQSVAIVSRAFRSLGFATSITIYGHEAKSVLDYREIYVPERVNEKMISSSGEYYQSGDNSTYKALRQAIPRLIQVAGARKKLLVVFTDGGLYGEDMTESPIILKKAIKDGITPMIFYLASMQKLLRDPRYERNIMNIDELIPAAVELARSCV